MEKEIMDTSNSASVATTTTLVYSTFVPHQMDFTLSEAAINEVERSKSFFKEWFIKNNKEYLDSNNYRIEVCGFLFPQENKKGKVKLQVAIFDSENKDVALDTTKFNWDCFGHD